MKDSLLKYAEDPSWIPFLHEFRRDKMKRPDWFADVLWQFWPGAGIPLHQAHAAALLNSLFHAGNVCLIAVGVGVEPCEDSAVEANNAALSNLPQPFKASFEPGCGGGALGDGVFSWTESLRMD